MNLKKTIGNFIKSCIEATFDKTVKRQIYVAIRKEWVKEITLISGEKKLCIVELSDFLKHVRNMHGLNKEDIYIKEIIPTGEPLSGYTILIETEV